jgi:hypothetical protein
MTNDDWRRIINVNIMQTAFVRRVNNSDKRYQSAFLIKIDIYYTKPYENEWSIIL